jgi:L-alanine-DL-glutamate epimerase-like enolase superfamily enzyme
LSTIGGLSEEKFTMHIEVQTLGLQLQNPFTLSYGTSTVRENVIVWISDGQFIGIGEAAVVPYYHETPTRVSAYITDPRVAVALNDDPLCLDDILDRLPPSESQSALAAVDMALHDLWAQHLGHPLYRLWGLNPTRCPRSSFTVAMTKTDAEYREHVQAAQQYGMVKLKLGSSSWEKDWRLVQIARQVIKGDLCVDANGGWGAIEALSIIPRLAELGVIFVEQPVARDDFDGWRTLRELLPEGMPPLIADESVQGIESVLPLSDLVDGINVKLAKTGGIRSAYQMITLARACGLKVMIGCMIESSVAVTAAAHLAPLADYADLDGNLLISNDPFSGVQMNEGYLTLPDRPGLGVIPRTQ